MIRPVLTEIALFLAPFAVYVIFLWATRTRVLDPANWSLSRVSWLTIAAFVLMIGSFLFLSHFGGAPPGSTYVPAHFEDGMFVPGQYRMMRRNLSSRRRLAARPAARAAARGARPRRRGGARRRRRGAQHAARRAGRRHRHRHHGAAGRGDAPGRGAPASRRCRPASTHGTVTVIVERQAVRGHDAARGRRDLRAPRQGGVRPRLAARRRAPRLHHERAVGHGRRHGARLCRRARRPRGAARALHRRGRDRASPRTICASCGSSASTRLYGQRPTRPGRPACLHRRPRRPRSTVARAHPHGTAQAAAGRRTRCRRSPS